MPILRKYDKEFFKKWSRDMAYILGFIFADGNLVKSKRGTHFLAIYSADKDLLFQIRSVIKSNHAISKRVSKLGTYYRIQIGSRELLDDLSKYNLTPNKAKRMKLPEIPKEYIGDFVRGYFDGDGCVWTGIMHKRRKKKTNAILCVFTSASGGFLRSLKSILQDCGLEGGSLRSEREGKYWRLSYSIADSLKLFKIMYNRTITLELHRKREIFERFVKMRA